MRRAIDEHKLPFAVPVTCGPRALHVGPYERAVCAPNIDKAKLCIQLKVRLGQDRSASSN